MTNPSAVPSREILEDLLDTSYFTFMEKYAEVGLTLPDFVAKSIPKDFPVEEIHYREGKFCRLLSGDSDTDLIALYDRFRGITQPLRLDLSLLEAYPEASVHGQDITAILTPGGPSGSRIILEQAPVGVLVATAYVEFLLSYLDWTESPSVVTAWKFLSLHPCFWTEYQPGLWVTDRGADLISVDYYYYEGSATCLIETGPSQHGEIGARHRYLHPDMCAVSPTMEESVMAVAEKTFKIYQLSYEEDAVEETALNPEQKD